jgi:pilus assembly protein CpaC
LISKFFKGVKKSLIAFGFISIALLYSHTVYTQDKPAAQQGGIPAVAPNPTPPGADAKVDAKDAKKAVTGKKKLTKHQKVKYRDINVVLGIRKEVYFDFPLGEVRNPTDTSIYRFEKNLKAQNPKLEKDRIIITGLKSGMTDLWVYDNQDVLKYVYNVTVTAQNLRRILLFLKKEFRSIEGLKMYIREQLIVLDGEILLPEDIARIHQVITGFENVFKLQFKLNPSLFNIIAEKMEKEIGLPDVHVEVINQRFVIKGNVKSKEEFNYVSYKAALYLPKYFYVPSVGEPTGAGDLIAPAEEFRDQPIINYFLTITEPDPPVNRVIKITVFFVEIAKNFQNDFGFTWAPSVDTDNSKMTFSYNTDTSAATTATAQPFIGTVTGIIQNFIPKLKDAVSHDRGRVIQSAAITVEDTKPGTIEKSTQYPYLVTAPNSSPTTQFASVGIGMGLTPTILGNKETSNDLNLALNVKVQQVVSMTSGVTGVPITATNAVTTQVNMKSEETAAIGGIINNTSTRAYGNNGGDDNIIINLSRSKNFKKNKSQFVVFITPTILKTTSEGSEEVKERYRIR